MSLMRQQQVVLAASSSEPTIGVWDIHTTTFLTAYKGHPVGRNALAALGRDYMVASQSGKAQALQFWTWHKDQVHQRCFTPEAAVSVACTPDGVYCAAGGEKGNIYIWEVGSGRLLRHWPAHYKSVTALAFADDGCLLLSGGEDAVVSAWVLMDILDASSQHNPWNKSPQPLHTWSEHTLPVTGLFVGAGAVNALVASVSWDRSCKIWSLAQGSLLRTIDLPVSLHSVVTDPWEHSLFLGAGDGRIFEASLVGRTPLHSPGQPPAEAALWEAGIRTLAGHTRTVNCLAATSEHLLSGSDDSSVRIWDLQSLQVLRVIAAKGPITSILVQDRPLHMLASRGAEPGREGPKRLQPLSPLAKHSELSAAWEGPMMILDGTQPYREAVVEAGLLPATQLETTSEATPKPAEVERLEEQLQAATRMIEDLREMNANLHAFVVETD